MFGNGKYLRGFALRKLLSNTLLNEVRNNNDKLKLKL